MNVKNGIPKQMGPCGVYCAACPSYEKTCNGCGSEDRNQKQKHKWGCKIRVCCLDTKKLQFCNRCDDFPCKSYRKKLPDSHIGDERFVYRHELFDSLARLAEAGVEQWLVEQEARWRCPECGGVISFYKYICSQCGYSQPVKPL